MHNDQDPSSELTKPLTIDALRQTVLRDYPDAKETKMSFKRVIEYITDRRYELTRVPETGVMFFDCEDCVIVPAQDIGNFWAGAWYRYTFKDE